MVTERLLSANSDSATVELGAEDAKAEGVANKNSFADFLVLGVKHIHGFGFASVLRELGVSSNGSGIAVPLFSFNLGVELGQILVAALLLPLIWKVGKRPVFANHWVPVCSALVTLAGTYWFVQRVWFN